MLSVLLLVTSLFGLNYLSGGEDLPIQEICPAMTVERQAAIEQITADMIAGIISEDEALARMRNVIPPECRPILIDEEEN